MQLLDQNPVIQTRLGLTSQEIVNFCQHWGITRLALFGSILRDDFQDDSDVDFLVTFDSNARQGLLTLAKMKHELESRLNRDKAALLDIYNAAQRILIFTTGLTKDHLAASEEKQSAILY